MSLKEITKDLHTLAESTDFMKSVFSGTLSMDVWADFVYQKTLFYSAIEGAAGALGLLSDLPDIQRTFNLYRDYSSLTGNKLINTYKKSAVEYYNYLLSINTDPDKILAHLYVWHMGDLYGGQMIKQSIPGTHTSLEFKNKDQLIANLRSKLNDTMGPEARIGFEWAIQILKEYDNTSLATST